MIAAPVDPIERTAAERRSAAVSGWDIGGTKSGREIAIAPGDRSFHRGEADAAQDQQNAEKPQEADAHAMIRQGLVAAIGGDDTPQRKGRDSAGGPMVVEGAAAR